MDPTILSLQIRNATDKKEGRWERNLDGLKGDEFSLYMLSLISTL